VHRQVGRTVEVESLAEFDARVAAGATSMSGWRLQDVDLRERGDVLARMDPRGSLFLGCLLDDDVESSLRHRGALVFPVLPDLPFDAYRSALYTPEELYDGLEQSYGATTDAVVYAWSQQRRRDLTRHLGETLHDLAIDDALDEMVRRPRVVGVMGGHRLERGSADYAAAATLGRSLTRAGLLVATGGGPGAMEAANLGAYLAPADDSALDKALALLAEAPTFTPSVTDWARAAFDVRSRWPHGGPSLGIPTWFYGHEPPNPFASAIAKYFKNAIREDVLLHSCTAGIVFLPGKGGTVQEVFQDACENYYADRSSVAPMVLVGKDYWTAELPVWPLLRSLAQDRVMEPMVHLVDDLDEVLPLLATDRHGGTRGGDEPA
jgi:predicted Rossmann-fold nucleotide-binding protein